MKKEVIFIGIFIVIILSACVLLTYVVIRSISGNKKSGEEAAFDEKETAFKDEEEEEITSPSEAVRLIFIHHSTGENWLADDNGGLGEALAENNYYVSDTNYGWGPDSIGDTTDIGHWWLWFRGPNSSSYLEALYDEDEQNCDYTRLADNPGGENEVVMFKSCFPNSALGGDADDSVPNIGSNALRGEDSGSIYHTVANAKGIYIDLLEYFKTKTDKLFIVITAPPLSDSTYANNARAFNNWLVNDWLDDYPYENVAVFDFFDVLADPNTNTLKYPSGEGDDHPSIEGDLLATEEFVPFLNSTYEEWEGR
jgi:hypothetical protein